MAEQTQAAAATASGNPGAPAQPAPSQPSSPPSGYRHISDGDFEQLNRYRQQYEGSRGLVEKAIAAGFKKPEDIDQLTPLMATLKQRNMTPAQLTQLLAMKAEQENGHSGSAEPSVDWEAKIAEATTKAEKNMLRMMALKEAEAADKQFDSHLDSTLKGYFGDENPDDYAKELHRWAMIGYTKENSGDPFPADHPLATERLQPYSDKHLGKAAEYFKGKKAAAFGNTASKVAAAAKQPAKAATPAGSGGGQGKPENQQGRQSTDDIAQARAEQAVAGMFN